MNKYFGTVAAAVIFLGCIELRAQYTDLLHPQQEPEISLMASHKIAAQVQYIEIKGSRSPYGLNHFDQKGRLIQVANPMKHAHYEYDADGRLVSIIDSVFDGRRFWKTDYAFQYDGQGNPQQFKMGKNTSAFVYDEATRIRTETKTDAAGMTTGSIFYEYNEDNKLVKETQLSTDGKLLHRRRVMYNKYGDLASEIRYDLNDNSADSTTILCSYDGKGKLLKKSMTIVPRLKTPSGEFDSVPQSPRNIVTFYTYDLKGNMTSERCDSYDNSTDYRKEYQYDQFGLLSRVLEYDMNDSLKKTYLYQYYTYK